MHTNTYHHPQRDIDTVVHGDDFVAVAEEAAVRSLRTSSREIPWRSSESEKCSSVSSMERRRIHLGGGSKADGEAHRHAELEWWKGSIDPGGKDNGRDVRDSDRELEYADAKLVQAAAGLEQYIALDRPDKAYSVKTALQQMSKHTKLMQLRVV